MDFAIIGLDNSSATLNMLLRRRPSAASKVKVRISVVLSIGTTYITVVTSTIAIPDSIPSATDSRRLLFRETLCLYRKHFQILHGLNSYGFG